MGKDEQGGEPASKKGLGPGSVREPARSLFDKAFREADSCIQCGYCLPACPTYASMGKESASPRGRIHLVKLASEGRIDPLRDLAEPIDLCLGCRACETACPVGVPYGHILEAAKEEIAHAQERSAAQTASAGGAAVQVRRGRGTALTRFALRSLFPHPRRMRLLGGALRLLQRSGMLPALRAGGLIRAVSPKLALFERALPRLPARRRDRLPYGGVAPALGAAPRARVALFTGCIMDAVLYRIHELTVGLLTRLGLEVVVVGEQTCCGALHAHQGLAGDARVLARRNIAAFERAQADWVVHNAGGCGAALAEYGHWLRDDVEWAERAERFAAKSRDISQLLVWYGPLPYAASTTDAECAIGVVTYQDSCHLRNVQKVTDEPRRLLRSIPGAVYAEMTGSDRCCGSGGIYNLLHYEESMAILDEKMGHVARTGAVTVVSGNPGCMLQLQAGIERSGLAGRMRSVHLVELLAEACGIG